ncbi:hypothetical protein B0J11DRAFT_297723 [Dendryphion nanum]|uniref:Methyltransferase n=1 Tax=Dendryphion nanum TaxID=256645 RepID=A0A9P9INL7_9PLEO|nr:hypothetical protein B0J11DRAFT_297723 [Dendryphion nanum]
MSTKSVNPPTEYILANPDEIQRLTYNHNLFAAAMNNNLVLAPIDFSTQNSLRILDSATANGLWLRDLASKMPNPGHHEFVGTDISPADFPSEPDNNFSYKIQDVNKPWPEKLKGSFDLVHQRLGLAASGTSTKFAVLALAELVKPGGWVQFVEMEDRICESDGETWKKAVGLMRAIFGAMNARLGIADEIAAWLRAEAGLVDVQEKVVEIGYGAKSGDATLAEEGIWATRKSFEGLIGFAKTLTGEVLGIEAKDLDKLPETLEKECRERGHSFFLRVVWGRKE